VIVQIEVARQLLSAAIGVGAAALLARQCRKPTWLPGRLITTVMNASHRRLTEWGLSHVRVGERFTILDVGCGGGKTVDRLASAAREGVVHGVDYSPASVATARRTNAARIASGRVDIRLGTVSALPFDADTFDLVTAVETHYYWPDLTADLREIRRVLRPGGTLAIVAETYRGRRMDWLYRPAMRLLRARYLTPAEHRALLTGAGYTDVEIFEEKADGWICAVGRKAA
jgi:SAM-dependent methyltransferase